MIPHNNVGPIHLETDILKCQVHLNLQCDMIVLRYSYLVSTKPRTAHDVRRDFHEKPVFNIGPRCTHSDKQLVK